MNEKRSTRNILRWKKSDRGSSHVRHGLDPRLEYRSREFPLCRPAVFSQTAVLFTLISQFFFHCSTTRMDEDTRFSCGSRDSTKDRFAWIIWSYIILSPLDEENIS